VQKIILQRDLLIRHFKALIPPIKEETQKQNQRSALAKIT